MRRIITCGLVAVLAFAAPTFAASWAVPSGSAAGFTYSNGQDVNGIFGSPVVVGNSMFFSTAFQAQAANGAVAQQNDEVSFDALANPGLSFAGMQVRAFGSYAITGDGEVDVEALVSVSENSGLNRTWTGPLVTNPAFPQTGGSSTWDGLAEVNIAFQFPTPGSDLHIALSNDVLAISGPGGAAEINVSFQSLEISFAVIPEPASLGLLALGGILVLRRRS